MDEYAVEQENASVCVGMKREIGNMIRSFERGEQ